MRAPKPREAVGQDPTPKIRLELTLDEGGQPGGLGVPGRVGQEGRKVGLDGSVEHGVLGLAALVGRRGGA